MATIMLLRQAKLGNPKSIERLARSASRDKNSFAQMLPILFEHLSTPPPADLDHDVPNFRFFVACLEAIATGLGAFAPTESPFLNQNLDNLRVWLLFLISKVLEPRLLWDIDFEFHQRLYRCTSTILIQSDLRFQPRFATLIMRVQLCGAKNGKEKAGMVEIPGATTLLLDELAEALDEGDLSTIKDLLWVMTSMCTGSSEETRRLIADQSIPLVARVMSQLSPRVPLPSLDAEDVELLTTTLASCAKYLSACFQYEGPACVKQALQIGILETMARSTYLVPVSALDLTEAYSQLLTRLCNFLLHPTVLRETRKWLRKVQIHRILKQLHPNSPLYRAWYAFHGSVERRLLFRTLYKNVERQICSNPQCTAPAVAVKDLKRCGGCLASYYCSQTCQKTHWTSNHHETCSKVPLPYSLKMDPLDRDFVQWAVSEEFLVIKDDEEYGRRLKECGGSHSAVVVMDYSGVAPAILVQSGKDFLNSTAGSGCDKVLKDFVAAGDGDFGYALIPDTEGSVLALHHLSRAYSGS
ncbi:hypothetical protein C8J56DRAFT_954133 [Mycena floridula]|nr:hypothetical protein C8J56DRAFT_954133 [Mycena floridula]